MNPAIEKLVELAKNEVGTREGAVNNTGARIVEYQGATWLQPGAWPWCAAFTCWLMRELLEDEAVLSEIAGAHPAADLQQLRALRRNALNEREQARPPRAYRELFKALRNLEGAASLQDDEQDQEE